LLPVLSYWAAEDYGAQLEVVYEAALRSLAEQLLAAVAAACDAATRPGQLSRLRAIFADAAADAADAERPNCAGHLEQIHGIFAAAAGQLEDEGGSTNE
jgi:hypothetical protein